MFKVKYVKPDEQIYRRQQHRWTPNNEILVHVQVYFQLHESCSSFSSKERAHLRLGAMACNTNFFYVEAMRNIWTYATDVI